MTGDDTVAAVRLLRDEQDVRDLGHRFADACNRGDVDAFRALWADDGRWIIDDPVGVDVGGADAVAATLAAMRPAWEFFVQLPLAPVVRVDGDRATSRWTVSEHARGVDGGHYANHARYDDELVRTRAGWRYLRRHYRYYHLDQG